MEFRPKKRLVQPSLLTLKCNQLKSRENFITSQEFYGSLFKFIPEKSPSSSIKDSFVNKRYPELRLSNNTVKKLNASLRGNPKVIENCSRSLNTNNKAHRILRVKNKFFTKYFPPSL